jgi:hypothetical protein
MNRHEKNQNCLNNRVEVKVINAMRVFSQTITTTFIILFTVGIADTTTPAQTPRQTLSLIAVSLLVALSTPSTISHFYQHSNN